MSDPNDPLRHLQQVGIDVNPLPASEVRRRGDRMRRRNTAVAVVGGIAAVVLVAVPLSLAAGGSNHSAPQPGPATSSPSTDGGSDVAWRQSIPPDFPLAEGLGGGESPGPMPGSGPAVADLAFCGVPTWSVVSNDPYPSVDHAAVAFRGASEDSRSRALAVYADDTTATGALEAIRSGVDACPRDPNGSGAPLVLDVVPADLVADDSLVFTQQSVMGGGLLADLTIFQVARVGNALYVATQHTSAGGPQVVDSEVQRMAGLSAPVISDLCIFAANPCAEPPTGATAIPADFPILDGYPEDSQAESESYGRSGPDTGQPPIRLDACGTKSPAPEATATLTGGWTNPEDFRTRQLVTFATPEAAAAWVQALTGLWADCPEEQTGDGSTTVRSVREGEEYAALVTQYRMQGGFTPGLTVATLVLRGNAVLLSQTYNEGGAGQHPDQEVDVQVDQGLSSVQGLVDAMCLYTDQGC